MTLQLILLAAGVVVGCAQQPPISNADLRQTSAANGLEAAMRESVSKTTNPAWIGYAVPAIPSENNSCCWNENGRGCGLEGQRTANANVVNPGPVRLEGPSHVVILMRFEQGVAEKLRVFSRTVPWMRAVFPFSGCRA